MERHCLCKRPFLLELQQEESLKKKKKLAVVRHRHPRLDLETPAGERCTSRDRPDKNHVKDHSPVYIQHKLPVTVCVLNAFQPA